MKRYEVIAVTRYIVSAETEKEAFEKCENNKWGSSHIKYFTFGLPTEIKEE